MMTLTQSLVEFNRLQDAEEYFQFFGLAYDPHVVNINRLHILRKFSQLMKAVDQAHFTEAERLEAYRHALETAYDVFLTSSSVQEKLFKVFQQKPKNVVMLSEIGME